MFIHVWFSTYFCLFGAFSVCICKIYSTIYEKSEIFFFFFLNKIQDLLSHMTLGARIYRKIPKKLKLIRVRNNVLCSPNQVNELT